MRPTGSGPLSALLVLAPLVALPILAVVGIPQFAGGNLIDSQNSVTNSATRKGVGAPESRSGEAARSDADDLFAPLGKSADGFEDPLRRTRKKSRSRTSRSDFESDFDSGLADNEDLQDEYFQDSDTGTRSKSRPRGKSPAFSNTGDDETQDQDLNSEQGSSVTSSRGTRSHSRGLNRDRDFEESTADETELAPAGDEIDSDAVEGEQYADNSNDFSGSSRPTKSRGNQMKRQQQSPDDADLALFESPPPKSNRNTPKSAYGSRPAAGRTRPVDPNDAPPFQPSGNSASAGESEAAEPEAEEPPPVTSPRKQSPRSQQMASAPDVTDEAIPNRNVTPTAPAANMSQEQSLKDLFDSLKAAGMVPESHHFVYVEESDTFLFTCRASRGGNSPPQKFEEEANEPLLAVYKVLKRVQTWQAKSSKKVRPVQ